MLANKFERNMKVLHADNGTEYCNRNLKQYLTSRGIKFESSAPYARGAIHSRVMIFYRSVTFAIDMKSRQIRATLYG